MPKKVRPMRRNPLFSRTQPPRNLSATLLAFGPRPRKDKSLASRGIGRGRLIETEIPKRDGMAQIYDAGTTYLVDRYLDDWLALTGRQFNDAVEIINTLLNGGLGLLPLATLSDVEVNQLPGVIQTIEERVDQECQSAEEANPFWTATDIPMGLRYPRDLRDDLLRVCR